MKATRLSRRFSQKVVAVQVSPTHSTQYVAQSQGNLEATKPEARKLRDSARQWLLEFLPKGYPHSVASNYLAYAQWQACASVFSSAGGVLSTQSLLFAIGLGATTSIPAAAALNWVIKDGLGQLGGMLFANKLSHRFDADPKRFRMISAYSLDTATAIEMVTPLLPHLFLPLAAVANIGKNISWLVASATRAGIHRTFVRQENMADITAKAGSQTMAACLVGTGMGIGLSFLAQGNIATLLLCFGGLSAGHLYSNYRSLKNVQLTTLNYHRLELLVLQFLDSGTIAGPEQLAAQETFLRPWGPPSKFEVSLEVGCDLLRLAPNLAALHAIQRDCGKEKFLLTVQTTTTTTTTNSISSSSSPAAAAAAASSRVLLLFLEGASTRDVLKGFLAAHTLRKELSSPSSSSSSFSSSSSSPSFSSPSSSSSALFSPTAGGGCFSVVSGCLARVDLPLFEQLLQSKGWNLSPLQVEGNPSRLHLEEESS